MDRTISARFSSPSNSTSEGQTCDSSEDRLRKDFERAAARVYSEDGIPMFLACEDLAPDGNAIALAPLNEHLASALRQHADAWQRIRPDAIGADVIKIIELLAERDFGASGTEKEP